jgi:hypothetical protein
MGELKSPSFAQRMALELTIFTVTLIGMLALGWWLDAPHWASVFTALILTEQGIRRLPQWPPGQRP